MTHAFIEPSLLFDDWFIILSNLDHHSWMIFNLKPFPLNSKTFWDLYLLLRKFQWWCAFLNLFLFLRENIARLIFSLIHGLFAISIQWPSRPLHYQNLNLRLVSFTPNTNSNHSEVINRMAWSIFERSETCKQGMIFMFDSSATQSDWTMMNVDLGQDSRLALNSWFHSFMNQLHICIYVWSRSSVHNNHSLTFSILL